MNISNSFHTFSKYLPRRKHIERARGEIVRRHWYAILFVLGTTFVLMLVSTGFVFYWTVNGILPEGTFSNAEQKISINRERLRTWQYIGALLAIAGSVVLAMRL